MAKRSSRFRGVTLSTASRWRAQISTDGHTSSLGDYDSQEAAAAAFDRAAINRDGASAATNFSIGDYASEVHVWEGLKFTEVVAELRARARAGKGPTSAGRCGVCLKRMKWRWHAQIRVRSKQVHLGYFATEVAAARAHDVAAETKAAKQGTNMVSSLTPASHGRDEVEELQQLPMSELCAALARDPLAMPESHAASSPPPAAASDSITFHGWCEGKRCGSLRQPPARGGTSAPPRASVTASEALQGRPNGLHPGATRKQPSACCSAASNSEHLQPPRHRGEVDVDCGGGRCRERDGCDDGYRPPRLGWPPTSLCTPQLVPQRGPPSPPLPPKRFPLLHSASAGGAAPPWVPDRKAAPSPVCSYSVGTAFAPHAPLHQPGPHLGAQSLQQQLAWQDSTSAIGAPGRYGLPMTRRLAAGGSTHNACQPLRQATPGGQQALWQRPRAVGSWSVAASSAAPAAPEAAPRVAAAQWGTRPRSERSRPAGGAWFSPDVAPLCGEAVAVGPPLPPRRCRKGVPSRAAD